MVHELAHETAGGCSPAGGGYALVQVVPRSWAYLAVAAGHPVDPGLVVLDLAALECLGCQLIGGDHFALWHHRPDQRLNPCPPGRAAAQPAHASAGWSATSRSCWLPRSPV
jgi:hypothetical protein